MKPGYDSHADQPKIYLERRSDNISSAFLQGRVSISAINGSGGKGKPIGLGMPPVTYLLVMDLGLTTACHLGGYRLACIGALGGIT